MVKEQCMIEYEFDLVITFECAYKKVFYVVDIVIMELNKTGIK